MVARARLRGHHVRMLSKNFPHTHQLDTDVWTDYLCTSECQDEAGRRVSKKRAFFVYPRAAYRITSSAWKRTIGAIVRPKASAVLRLMTKWNSCRSIGRSAGLAPFWILSTKAAE